MMVYHQFMKIAQWTPRQVDELYEDEEYWLPVIEAASTEAIATWNDVQSRSSNGPLAY
jgi:hypothetical protein